MESRYLVIDLNALNYNFTQIKSLVGKTLIMPVIKANAYGHGLIEIGTFFQNVGADYLAVAAIEEAIQLRKNGVIIPILVVGCVIEEQLPLFLQNNIDIMAASIEKLVAINNCATKYGIIARVHLKLDTGLARIGVRHTNAESFFLLALKLMSIDIVAIASHFATSDDQDTTFMKLQTERFYECCLIFKKLAGYMPLRHIANSGAVLQSAETYFDMVRPGIMLYGVYPSSWMKTLLDLKPVMSLYARVVYFKVLLKDSGISYGLTFKAEHDTRVVTLPVGYGDGYSRSLSNKAHLLFKGKKYPVVGNICMDQMMVDIGSDSAYSGDEFVLIGKSGALEIRINDLVDLYGGSVYEFLTAQNGRIPRRYVGVEEGLCGRISDKDILQGDHIDF